MLQYIRHISIILACLFIVVQLSYAQDKLVILHTNDTHSRIEPMPASDKKYPAMGGVRNRKAVIDSIRAKEKNVLLLDAGDFVQGTPFFNLFGGRVEAKVMNDLKYDAGTLGNHEFDNGLDSLKMIVDHLNFPLVNCNYDFSNTVLKNKIKPYTILQKGNIRIGVLGLGVNPQGLIQESKYRGMLFYPIVESANKYVKELKEKYRCDVIICLSHNGIREDVSLAKETKYIDIIIGGHSHTFMEEPERVKNMEEKDVLVYQTGKNGVYLGKIELYLQPKSK